MDISNWAGSPIFSCMLPAFILDQHWNIAAMNPAFRRLAGDEWGCRIGTPVQVIIDALDNRDDVTSRAQRLFFGAQQLPTVDHEYCRFTSGRYGVVEFQKVGICVSGVDGAPDFWIIQLNILSADRREQLFDDLAQVADRRRRSGG
jgi:hypothetical protein